MIVNPLVAKTQIITSNMNIYLKYARPVVHSINNCKYEYIRFKKNQFIVHLLTKDMDSIYLIPTLNSNIIAYYFDAKNLLKKHKLDELTECSNNEYRKAIKNVFDEVHESTQNEEINDIWIPKFSISGCCGGVYEGLNVEEG